MSCFRRKANRRYTVVQIEPKVVKKPSQPIGKTNFKCTWSTNNKLLIEPIINGDVRDDNRYNDIATEIHQSENAPPEPSTQPEIITQPEPEPIPTKPSKSKPPESNHEQVQPEPKSPPEETERIQKKNKAPPVPKPTVQIEQPLPEPPQLIGSTTQPDETSQHLLTVPQNRESLSRSSSEGSLVHMNGDF